MRPVIVTDPRLHIAVIGAGIGGLAAALRLAHGGARVTVFESQANPGGKMRTVPSAAGSVDAGPTVLTMRNVFDTLFEETGSTLDAHVTLEREEILARHFWPDGTRLDLMADAATSAENIGQTFGPRAAKDFAAFHARTRHLFDAFDAPMMRSAAPSALSLTARVLRDPRLLLRMEGHRSLARSLARQFSEPKLARLFGRYATYVGGIPQTSPALLALIWQAEARGVWHVRGGMHALAQAIHQRAKALGATFHFNSPVTRIEMQAGRPAAVDTAQGRTPVDAVLFNGDPRALEQGLLGQKARGAVSGKGTSPRSLSACVHAFAADCSGPDLAAHNVFFCADARDEFGPLSKGQAPRDATVYLCAQDRFAGRTPTGPERFELIVNAPPAPDGTPPNQEETHQCHRSTMARLARFGLRFTPEPGPEALTMPQDFAALFPASNGALYGRSPQGMMAAFQRPIARSRIPGLYLVGGGAHPGAGVPMATLSAAHAAAAMLSDLSSTSTSPQAATPGGTSTVSPTMASAPSRSSAS
ncbi:MAG: phytoene desaturase [Sulfitobacter sp.]|nr:phytoene desaturase [Sulfitobacter sp.]